VGVHASGDGAAWASLEALDADQPHGLDYRESVHMAKAIRKRLDQEHTTFADATVGGIHMPGGVAVLGMELTNAGGDITSVVVGDGTYRARGLVWAWDGSQDARLWCSTAAAGASTTGDWTLLALNPDKQWGGGDVSWAGDHVFAGSVCVAGEAYFDSNVDISGKLTLSGDISVSGLTNLALGLTVGTDVSVGANLAVDGSSNFTDDVAVAADLSVTGYIKADGTTSAFGRGTGIELYYDPTVYAAAESMTFPNGLIMKTGTKTIGLNGTADVSFAVAFAAPPKIFITGGAATHTSYAGQAASQASTGFIIWASYAGDYDWLAIGR